MENNEDKVQIPSEDMESNMGMVHYIMLHRIYDMLTLIANKVVGEEDINKVINYHEMGYLLGPTPSFTPTTPPENIANIPSNEQADS